MIDASAILQQIQAGENPETWYVVRPRSQVRFATTSSFIIFGFLFNLLAFGLGLQFIYTTSNQQLGKSPWDFYTHYPLLALIAHTVAIILTLCLTLLLRYYAIILQDSVLILLPEGIFHCKRPISDIQHDMKTIEYQNITRMLLEVSEGGELLQKKIITFDFDIAHPSSFYEERRPVPSIFWGRYEFRFIYADGTSEIWFPPVIYQRSYYDIAQKVLNDFRTFAQKG